MPRAKARREPVEPETLLEEPLYVPDVLPLLPIRDNVYFPHHIFPLIVGRDKSVRALEEARTESRMILLVSQREAGVEDPGPEDLYDIGIAADIMHILNIPDGTVRVMLEGVKRVRIRRYIQMEPYYRVRVEALEESVELSVETEALMRSVASQFQAVCELGRTIPPEVLVNVMNVDDAARLTDMITPALPLKVDIKQSLLETLSPNRRLERLNVLLNKEIEILEIQKNIRNKVEKEMGDTQREFILREQLKAIQQELGERDERGLETDDYRVKIEAADMPEDVQERAFKELERLNHMPYAAPEGVVVRNYLDWLTDLPWSVATPEALDIRAAEAILNEDHYGLQKVKERILEFLAVRQLAGTPKGPILCFSGPPGVGKTSIGKSIARSLGRKFIRVSLGGVRDEAEIRGHRRTYVGAMPGRIIQGIKTAGSNNPVFMLDEIDKIGADFRGDPSAALLEALDPEQNSAFSDHYLEAPFDLSKVMFITTANLLDPVPPALRDRMEVIAFPGYTEEEKLEIAKGFLLPKQIKDHGLTDKTVKIAPAAVTDIIRHYTREAGVRNLEREIATVCRKVARGVAEGTKTRTNVSEKSIATYLGPRRYHYGLAEEKDEIGVATGLSVSSFGGDVLSIEVTLMAGDGKLLLTGQLGDVMKESAQAAMSYLRSHAKALGIDETFYGRTEAHIHVPEGGIPKDGPSAGVTMTTALASALTQRPVRREVAMTGEVTLRGRVLPVGGIKDKVLAAHRAGITEVILPADNEKDLVDIPEKARAELKFHLVSRVDEVLRLALHPKPEPEGEIAV
ncbi:MAG TPA: endopeptidase La [Armatimonadota bacterium]|jgi:ATP-dependent Lon protease